VTEHVCKLSDPWPTGHPLPPENPDRLTGPEVGATVRYNNEAYPRWDRMLVRVVARSYVWFPGECRSNGGYRSYDWTVIEWPVLSWDGKVVWKSMVVDDKNLRVTP
jgi:hypothetical protein